MDPRSYKCVECILLRADVGAVVERIRCYLEERRRGLLHVRLDGSGLVKGSSWEGDYEPAPEPTRKRA